MKKIFITMAAAVLVLASCSKDEVSDQNSQSPDAIKFSSTTSRAAVSNLATLTGDATGFKVYGTSGSAPATWYNDGANSISGSNNYKYGTAWGWTNPVKWPTVTTGYPMKFYAMYPASMTTTASVTAGAAVISSAVTIPAVASQVDMLSATAQADAKPSDATLALTFEHILSKVNFGIIAGNGASVMVQSLTMKNALSAATYNHVAKTWGAAATGASYDYWPLATIFPTTGSAASEDVPVPFYAAGHSNHLMLMPQENTTKWDISTPAQAAATKNTGAYIEVVYRITRGVDNYIGYTDATKYLSDNPSYSDIGWGAGANVFGGINTGTAYGAKAFFIKVGFPLEITWAKGKGYTYNICLGTSGSTNGYYVETTYIDEYGQVTPVPIVGPGGGTVDPGDPVTDGYINFIPVVTDWDDQTAIPAIN